MSRVPGPCSQYGPGCAGEGRPGEFSGVRRQQTKALRAKTKENKRERGAMDPPPFPGAVEEGPLYRGEQNEASRNERLVPSSGLGVEGPLKSRLKRAMSP